MAIISRYASGDRSCLASADPKYAMERPLSFELRNCAIARPEERCFTRSKEAGLLVGLNLLELAYAIRSCTVCRRWRGIRASIDQKQCDNGIVNAPEGKGTQVE